jgi:hypothetical protein
METDLVEFELVTDPEDVQEVIGCRFREGPMVVCDKCMDATQTIVASVIFMDDSEPPLLLCQTCLEDFENSFDQVEE